MIKYIAYFLLFYFLFKIIRSLFRVSKRPSDNNNVGQEKKSEKQKDKIFSEDEGEYVDYEDVDK